MSVCIGCKYYNQCGDSQRTVPCNGRESARGVGRPSAYERARAAVYATGNKWAIENFHATHD